MADAVRHERSSAEPAVGPGRAANLLLRFVLELAALAALAYWGFSTGTTLLGDLILGAGAPLVAAVVWGTWAAPKSARRLRGGALLVVQLAVLGAGAAALVAAEEPGLGAAMAVLVVVNAALLRAWGDDGAASGRRSDKRRR